MSCHSFNPHTVTVKVECIPVKSKCVTNLWFMMSKFMYVTQLERLNKKCPPLHFRQTKAIFQIFKTANQVTREKLN